MSDYMGDLGSLLNVQTAGTIVPKHTTNEKAGKSLDMDGFLQLMVAMLQNQTMDSTADTSEMMNQMVQMSVVQAITDISTLVNQSTSLTYAASLVGKEVTIGQYDAAGKLHETVGEVTGTGTLKGQQVVFIGNDCYYLTDIMAVGRLPDEVKTPGSGSADSQEKVPETGESTEGNPPESAEEVPGAEEEMETPADSGEDASEEPV